jgi:hypothetical protein
MQMASAQDQEALKQMMLEGKITFFDVGTQLYPVKSLGTRVAHYSWLASFCFHF